MASSNLQKLLFLILINLFMAGIEPLSDQQFIKHTVARDKVVVFSKTYCPYCKQVKNVFREIQQSITAVELDQTPDGPAILDTLMSITGIRTVPQVFIKGKFVGGSSDLKALYDSGKLQSMLAAN